MCCVVVCPFVHLYTMRLGTVRGDPDPRGRNENLPQVKKNMIIYLLRLGASSGLDPETT